MDIPVVVTALDPQKRRRDADGSYSSDESEDQTSPVKRICSPRIEDLNISSILEKVVDATDLYEVNELDEAQEKLVYGVMKSLEEEICVSGSSYILFHEGVDSTPLQIISQEAFLTEEFSPSVGDDTSSTSCLQQLESFELPSLLESIYSSHERSSKVMEISTLIHEAEDEPDIIQSETRNLFGIGYLLEASDDELGIPPSPSSRSFCSETDFISGKLLATDATSSNDTVHFEPWQLEWDCSSETFHELAHDGQTPDQELLRCTEFSPPDVVDNVSVGTSPSLDTTYTCLGPADWCY